MILAAIFIALALMLVPTLRGYLAQRAQIEALETEVATRQQQVDELNHNLERWQDPAFVEQQARERLKFVRPGETSYQVIDAGGLVSSANAQVGSVVRPESVGATTWYERVWSSVDAADSLSPKDVSAPLAPVDPNGATPTTGQSDSPGAPASSGILGTSAPTGSNAGTAGNSATSANSATLGNSATSGSRATSAATSPADDSATHSATATRSQTASGTSPSASEPAGATSTPLASVP